MSLLAYEMVKAAEEMADTVGLKRGRGSMESRHGAVSARRDSGNLLVYKNLNSEPLSLSEEEAVNVIQCLQDLLGVPNKS